MSPPTSIRSSLAEALAGWPPPALDPAGPFSERIVVLSWVLFAMSAVVQAIVLIALGLALFGGERCASASAGSAPSGSAESPFPWWS